MAAEQLARDDFDEQHDNVRIFWTDPNRPFTLLPNNMEEPSVWDLIKAGRLEEACVRADVEFQENGDILLLRNKVLALLQLTRFAEAAALSERIIILTQGSTGSDYIFSGVASWLGGQRSKAVETWRAGVRTQFTDAVGGVEVPMLLFFAAARTGERKLEKEAVDLLKRACKSKRIGNWPGPIARFLLGSLSEMELVSQIDAVPILQEKQACQADFYIGLKRFRSGDLDGSRESLLACVDHRSSCIVKAELHLARGELKSA